MAETTTHGAQGPDWPAQWRLRPAVTYLNHGSFGPPPEVVREAYRRWTDELHCEPIDFLNRQMVPLLADARQQLGRFVSTAAENLVFIENATAAMNAVAQSVRLSANDEVLITDHDYGAVHRIWQRACDRAGARLVVQPLAVPISGCAELIEGLLAGLTPRTRLLVFSHITSPTALIFPAAELTRQAHAQGVQVCIDGPHALAMIDLDLDALDCDYYTASCHKWLCGPLGSGFLYVHPRNQGNIQPAVLSWGRHPPQNPASSWTDEFTWSGTRSPAAYLAVPTAIDFLKREAGLQTFRQRTHEMARLARERIGQLTGLPPLTPDDPACYGSMITLPLPPGDAFKLQQALWERFGIEVPIVAWNDQRYVRVSCHLYNTEHQIELLARSLHLLLAG